MLRLMKRIVSECLPSEHLNKSYSIASTADNAWILLQQKDRELYDHLQNSDILIESSSSSSSSSSTSTTDAPRSLQLLSCWLETCFIGYIKEHAALFIWDQLALLGGTPDIYHSYLPQICCLLLQLIRDDLLKTPTDLKKQLLISGKTLKTIIITNEIRNKILMISSSSLSSSSSSSSASLSAAASASSASLSASAAVLSPSASSASLSASAAAVLSTSSSLL
jgi:hypothetical protein